jgi:hypothetical protein
LVGLGDLEALFVVLPELIAVCDFQADLLELNALDVVFDALELGGYGN